MIPHYVLFIHGIGEAEKRFSRPLPDEVRKEFAATVTRILSKGPSQDGIACEEAVWSDITQNDQDRLWECLFPDLGRKSLSIWSLLKQPSRWIPRVQYFACAREFVVHHLGDSIAYVKSPGINKYEEIHKRVLSFIRNCAQDARNKGATAQKPALLTIVTHSLGSVIASDLIYDVKYKGVPWPSELRFANFITMGSPLALYVLRYGFEKPKAAGALLPFSSPIGMDDQEGLWTNIFDPQDALGYPLKPLNEKYEKTVFIDKEINAGQWWKVWQWLKQASPFSHTLYWEDETVAAIIGRKAAIDWLRENHPELGPVLKKEYEDYKSWVACG